VAHHALEKHDAAHRGHEGRYPRRPAQHGREDDEHNPKDNPDDAVDAAHVLDETSLVSLASHCRRLLCFPVA